MAEPQKIWIDQCDATANIENNFGTQPALDYLIGEKFLDFLEAAEHDVDFEAEISAFVARIKTIFERWQLAAYLETARKTESFDPALIEPGSHPLLGAEEVEFSTEDVEDMRKDDIRQCTRDLLLVERAREWLLEERRSWCDEWLTPELRPGIRDTSGAQVHNKKRCVSSDCWRTNNERTHGRC